MSSSPLEDANAAGGGVPTPGGPRLAWLVTTSKCNLSCTHCPRSIPEFEALADATPDMARETFERFVEQVLPTLERVQFGGTNLGEPTISRSFDEDLERIARAPSVRRVNVQTNGTALTPARLRRCVELGVRLTVSLEGTTGTSYFSVRGFPFERLMKALRLYKTLRDENPETGAELYLGNFTVVRDNLHELPALLELGKEVGADQITVCHLTPWRESQRYQSLYYHQAEANAAFDEALLRARELGVNLVLPTPFENVAFADSKRDDVAPAARREPPCFHPWESVSINENGDVMPCCRTNAVLGNLRRQDFSEIWNGRRYQQLRARVNSARPPSYCRGCTLRGVDMEDKKARLYTDPRDLLRRIGFGGDGSVFASAGVEIQRRSIQWLRRTLEASAVGRRIKPGLQALYRRLK